MFRFLFLVGVFCGTGVQAASLNSAMVLKPIEPLVMTDFVADEALTCEEIPSALAKQKQAGLILYSEISKYLGAISIQYGNWFAQLSPLESGEAEFVADQFQALEKSVKAGERAVLLWDDISEVYRNQIFLIADSFLECAENGDDAKKEALYLDLETLADESFELDSTVSSFMGLMFNALEEFHQVVKKIEGKKLRLSSGFFKDLKTASTDFHEAGILVNGGYQYLDKRLKALELQILELLPEKTHEDQSKGLASAP